MSYPHSETKPTLYNAVICPYAQRAVIALNESGVPYEKVDIDLSNKPAWYPQVNPEGKVPALRLNDGRILIESLLIVEYISETYPQLKLMPADNFEKYQVRLFIEYMSNKVTPHVYGIIRAKDAEQKEQTYQKLMDGLKFVNGKFTEFSTSSTGPYVLGDRFSVADIACIPFIDRMDAVFMLIGSKRFSELEGLERLKAWADACHARKSIAPSRCDLDVLVERYKAFR
ncbi:Glutathione S-transferase omega-1 [Zancudomyces culisetae]|uniref:Glutathione S-transferase omega-1 n=1 Tax=Zancudomyces culisetae TaxID=1213189 RepID=A0A1R1PQU0_ZANCU|nr:Glutathione S-transferase omega-1 [Zancudomyces culisetae]|eukprot:OMH83319.1 Glutathione S-transferase omega-1 [Zancudomyces culisetae]